MDLAERHASFVLKLGVDGYEEEALLKGERLLYHEGSSTTFEYLDTSGAAKQHYTTEEVRYYDRYVRKSAFSEAEALDDAHHALRELANLLKNVVVLSPSPNRMREPVLLGVEEWGA